MKAKWIITFLAAALVASSLSMVFRPAAIVTRYRDVPGPVRTVVRVVPGPVRTVIRTVLVTPSAAPAALPPMPHVNGATHSELVNCLQAQCTSFPGSGPNGGTCGPVVNNEQECVW